MPSPSENNPLTEITPNTPVQDDAHLRVMRLLDARPQLSQREMAAELGISLGKTNYCLRVLVEKGFVKVDNFRKSDRKFRYLYQLTPKGIENKARLTLTFLERKRREYEALRQEIDALSRELGEAED